MIDNKKMWESIIKYYRQCNPAPQGYIVRDIFDDALNDQNLEYKNGKILYNIWFKCTHTFDTAYDLFEEGGMYRYCDAVRLNPNNFGKVPIFPQNEKEEPKKICSSIPSIDYNYQTQDGSYRMGLGGLSRKQMEDIVNMVVNYQQEKQEV